MNFLDSAIINAQSLLLTSKGTVGGGEILNYMGTGEKTPEYIRMDNDLIKSFRFFPYVKALIIFLIVLIAVLIIIRIFDVKSPFRGKAITKEIRHLEKIRRRDAAILTANQNLGRLTRIIEHSPFSMNKSNYDYNKYNLERANVKIPGGTRIMKPEELNALIVLAATVSIIVSALITVFLSAPIGVILGISLVVMITSVPMMVIRTTVKQKDNEIIEHFADMYLMLHYVLLASAGTPLTSVLKSFDKTTDSEEMHRFVDTCVHYFDTYGEYNGTNYITKQYREIPEVAKLMRLIRQNNDGADVRAELIGFRNELLSAKKYAIRKRMEGIVKKAQLSFNILTPILIQAILSAMAIYVKDISLTSSFL